MVGGYWSHIWIDMLNIRGADLFWPSPIRLVMPGNRKYRVEVGSKAEMVLLTSLVATCLALYPVSGVGFCGGLQHLLGNFEMAKDAFIEQAGTKWFTLELEAIDNLTLEHIHCQCSILGTWHEGLIVLHGGRPRAVGHSQIHHNLYPTSAKLLEGEPLRVVSHKVDMRGRSLRWLLARLDKQHTYYLSGEMKVGSRLDQVTALDRYHPASFDGKVLQLHYARAQELAPYLDLAAAQGEVYVQFWLKPGDPPVETTLDEEGQEEVIPEALKESLVSLQNPAPQRTVHSGRHCKCHLWQHDRSPYSRQQKKYQSQGVGDGGSLAPLPRGIPRRMSRSRGNRLDRNCAEVIPLALCETYMKRLTVDD